jgi:dTDP-4-dehydrorhamnose reductase
MESTDNRPKVMILGHKGKLGRALFSIFASDHNVIGANRSDFDAADMHQVRRLISVNQPDLVINAAAFVGIDACECDPISALKVNSLFPKQLAELANELKFTLIHFSTDAVFADCKNENSFTESSRAQPINIYGCTKYNADCLIAAIAKQYYICRISLLFGPTDRKEQFVEKMLSKIYNGQKELQIANDVICSPSYSLDIAKSVKGLCQNNAPYGLYHIANEGRISLFTLIRTIILEMNLPVEVRPTSKEFFPSRAIKNSCTSITSEKIESLRPWQTALQDYLKEITLRREENATK